MRLTDRQRKKIVADYLETQSINAAAKKNNVSWKTAKEVIDSEEDILKKLEQKKEQNAADILAYMESKRERVCEILDVGLNVLPDKIKNARTASEVTTAMGTLIDKFTAFNGAAPGGDKEDGLSKSLKEMAKELESDE